MQSDKLEHFRLFVKNGYYDPDFDDNEIFVNYSKYLKMKCNCVKRIFNNEIKISFDDIFLFDDYIYELMIKDETYMRLIARIVCDVFSFLGSFNAVIDFPRLVKV